MRDWLYNSRKEKGYTQEDIARIIGVTRQYYGMIENGVKTPSVIIAKKIGKTLNIEWTSFFQ